MIIQSLFSAFVTLCFGYALAEDTWLLMIGNSYTSSNSLSTQIQSMLRENSEYLLANTYAYSPGGASFVDHLDDASGNSGGNNQLRKWLVTTETRPWSWVVLQDQSLVGAWYGLYMNWYYSMQAAMELNELIAATGGDTVFFMTWGRRDGYDELLPDFLSMTEQLRIGYGFYAEAVSSEERPAKVAPVGLAFKYVYDEVVEEGGNPLASGSKFYALYSGDGSHPSAQGSYLAACVIYATLTGKDPRRLSYGPSGVNAETRVRLRSVAYHTVAAYESWPVTDPPSIALSPTMQPKPLFSDPPSTIPTAVPSTQDPTMEPRTDPPSLVPTTEHTTLFPTLAPTTPDPTVEPTTLSPTVAPTMVDPTAGPTTLYPTLVPTTGMPTTEHTTISPTSRPKRTPTVEPTKLSPTVKPTTQDPTLEPIQTASTAPSVNPSLCPSSSPVPFTTTDQSVTPSIGSEPNERPTEELPTAAQCSPSSNLVSTPVPSRDLSSDPTLCNRLFFRCDENNQCCTDNCQNFFFFKRCFFAIPLWRERLMN